MRKRALFLALCVATVLTGALCGCKGGKSDELSTLVVGIPQDLEDSLDPHKAVAAGTKEILFNVYEGLLKPDSQGNIVPAVAEDYSISEDGRKYTFTIRDGIKFHNGNPVTAEDVKYSIEKSAGMTGETSLISAFSNIADVSVQDERTVVITLTDPDIDFPAYIGNTNACIIPKDNDKPDTNPIGTGPYMYVSRSPQENIILKSFGEYWGEKANIENITVKIIPDADSIVMNLNGGGVDMFAHLSATQVAQLGDSFNILEGEMNLVQAVYLNHNVKPFDDVRVCKALTLAIDKEEIFNLTSDGKGFPVASSMFPAFKKYYVDLNGKYEKNVEEAKKLLAEAGYADGFEFSMVIPSNYQPHIDTAQVVAEQLKEIGVTADIQLIEWNSWLSDVYSGRNFEATVIGVDASSLTAGAMLDRYRSDASNNFTNYSNPEYDEIYNQIFAEKDDAKRTELFGRLQEILCDDAANVYIQDMAEFVALSNKFDGYTFYPMYIQDLSKIKFKQN